MVLEDSQTHPGNKNSRIHWQGVSIYFSFLIVFCNGFRQGKSDREDLLLRYFYLLGSS